MKKKMTKGCTRRYFFRQIQKTGIINFFCVYLPEVGTDSDVCSIDKAIRLLKTLFTHFLALRDTLCTAAQPTPTAI